VKHSTQIHDFNPGFGAPVDAHGDSTFWTAAIPDKDVQFHSGAGKAEMRVTNLPMEDYFNFPNALADGHEVDATVSFDVVWSGPVTRRVEVENGSNGDQFAGTFQEDQVTVTWSGTNALGFSFHSNPGDLSTSVPGRGFAEIGHERNGLFFEEGEGEGDGEDRGSSPERGSGSDDGGRDQAFAAVALLAENRALHPTSAAMATDTTDPALRDPWTGPLRGPGQMSHTGGWQNGSANGFTGQDAMAVRAAGDGAFTFAPDPALTSMVTDVGVPGEDVLFR
jgi:hypothetical protein